MLVGNSGWLQRLPMPAVQAVLLGLTVLCLLLAFKVASWSRWISGLDLRSLVWLHVTRFVGFYFLLLYRRGELPFAFAVPGGWGDNVVAALALLVCLWPMTDATRRRAITIWNVVGFVDIVLVVLTAARLGLEDPRQMRALTYLPLSLLPTFLVPLILSTHILVFLRLRRRVNSA